MDARTISSNKRGNNVVSRRVGQATSEEVRPLKLPATTATGSTKASSHLVAPPRSGTFILPTFVTANTPTSDHSSRDHHNHKRHQYYQVNLPTRTLFILAMVFLAVPLMIFFYKEVHIHDHHHQAHFKPEKFVNVNTREVISQFSNHAHEQKHQSNSGDDEESDSSTDEGIEERVEEKLESSTDSQNGDKDRIVEPENEPAEEAEELQNAQQVSSPSADEDTPEDEGEHNDEGEVDNNESTQEDNGEGAVGEKEEEKELAKGPKLGRQKKTVDTEVGSRRTNRIQRRV